MRLLSNRSGQPLPRPHLFSTPAVIFSGHEDCQDPFGASARLPSPPSRPRPLRAQALVPSRASRADPRVRGRIDPLVTRRGWRRMTALHTLTRTAAARARRLDAFLYAASRSPRSRAPLVAFACRLCELERHVNRIPHDRICAKCRAEIAAVRSAIRSLESV